MKNEDEFFAELHPQVVEVLGTALMQVLVEQREPSREALIEMIQVLWQEEDVDLAVELAIDVLTLPKEYGSLWLQGGGQMDEIAMRCINYQ